MEKGASFITSGEILGVYYDNIHNPDKYIAIAEFIKKEGRELSEFAVEYLMKMEIYDEVSMLLIGVEND